MTQPPGYRRPAAGVHPPHDFPAYHATLARHPRQAPVAAPQTLSEITGPSLGLARTGSGGDDLTRQHAGEPLGERIIVSGRVLDGDGRAVAGALVEVWQANAAGRYAHPDDMHDAPLDPNFTGTGRMLTDAEGRYRIFTIKPGAYPWQNHGHAWRPAHIHFSVLGRGFLSRLVTQMYFPGDPLLPLDPIFNSVPDERARARLVAALDLALTRPEWALGYRFDIVLRGREATAMDP